MTIHNNRVLVAVGRNVTLLIMIMMIMTIPFVLGFGITTTRLLTTRSSTSSVLYMGIFDFNPFTGSGSGKEKDWKEEQWEAQQAILKNRENAGLTKQQLADKYNKIKKNSKAAVDDDDEDTTIATTPVKASSPAAFFASTATTAASATPSTTKAATPLKVAEEEDNKSFKIPTFKMPWDK